MTIRAHYLLGATGAIIASILGFLFFGYMQHSSDPRFDFAGSGIYFFVVFFGSTVGMFALVRFIVRLVIPARCPKCNGRAYREDGKRVIYLCRSCGHREDTGFFESSSVSIN